MIGRGVWTAALGPVLLAGCLSDSPGNGLADRLSGRQAVYERSEVAVEEGWAEERQSWSADGTTVFHQRRFFAPETTFPRQGVWWTEGHRRYCSSFDASDPQTVTCYRVRFLDDGRRVRFREIADSWLFRLTWTGRFVE